MRTCVTLKFVATLLLIIAPAVIGDGFKDYQLKFGYGIGEYRVIKWLNKIIRLDRATDPQVSQFPPIKVHEKPFEVQQHSPLIKNASQVPFIPSPANNPSEPISHMQTQEITEATQVPPANNSPPQSTSHDSSSKSSSADSTETPSVSALGHSYKDYLYMKWFHGSPNATYFNENPVPDKQPSIIDNKSVQGSASPEIPPLKSTANHNVSFTNSQQPALLSFLSDSLLSRMFNTVMRIAIPKFKKEDVGPLKFYETPIKPQSLPVPPVIDFPSQKNPLDQLYGSAQVFNNYLASNPLPIANSQPVSKLDKPLAATTFNPLNVNYGLSYDLPIPVDIQPSEPQSFNSQPQTIISVAERNYVPLQTAYSSNKRSKIDNPSAQLELEPDNGALLLAFKPQVPTYA